MILDRDGLGLCTHPALYAVSLASPNRVSSWRMPAPHEDPTGICAKRYYVPGTR
jgi:hypothetical protein